MNIYEKMGEAIYCGDFFQCLNNIQNFTEEALIEKNRANIVKNFYERLTQYAMSDYIFDEFLVMDEKQYLIYDGENAVAKYMALSIPKQRTPVKSLHNIKLFAEQTQKEFMISDGNHITKKKASEIMNYLDNEYSFSKKVFSDRKAMFLILNVTHKNCNAECIIMNSDNEIIQHLFLYCLSHELEYVKQPEAVLFHELGHAIHARYTKDIDIVPNDIFQKLERLCFPGLCSLSLDKQKEIFADVLGMGLMYGSPFAEVDPFYQIYDEHKKEFKKLIKDIFSSL